MFSDVAPLTCAVIWNHPFGLSFIYVHLNWNCKLIESKSCKLQPRSHLTPASMFLARRAQKKTSRPWTRRWPFRLLVSRHDAPLPEGRSQRDVINSFCQAFFKMSICFPRLTQQIPICIQTLSAATFATVLELFQWRKQDKKKKSSKASFKNKCGPLKVSGFLWVEYIFF